MPSTNLVISRLQNQRSRIQGMLSPGKKQRQSGGSLHAPLSPVASDFAGRKFQLAARKMRTLDAGNLGQTLSGGLTSLSTDIQSKFADIQKIIHINPGTSRQDNIWSSVETPLPDGQPARHETPSEPGVMRAGSIIQKMNMVPKPGQSLESFKDQVQTQPRTKKTPVDKKPVIDQNTRRFSQVQEVTPGQKQAFPEIPAVPVKSDDPQTPLVQEKETSETQPPPTRAKKFPETTTVQSQPDTSVSVTEKPVVTPSAEAQLSKPSATPVKQDLPPEMPLRAQPRSSQPVAREEQQTLTKTPPVEPLIVRSDDDEPQADNTLPKRQTDQPPQPPLPVQEKELLKALPVVKKPPVQDELKKALPVKKEQKQPQKPVARPTLKSRTDAPLASAPPVIQRQQDVDLSPSVPMQLPTEIESPVAAPVRPVPQPRVDDDLTTPVLPARETVQTPKPADQKLPAQPAPSQAEPGKTEMPLRQNIVYRQNAARAIRSIAPDQMKPVTLPPLIHREDTKLFARPKYSPASTQGTQPEFSPKKDPSLLPGRDRPPSPFRLPDVLPMDLPHSLAPQAPAPENLSPIQMPLVSQVASPAPFVAASKPESALPPVQTSLEKLSRRTTGVAKTNNTIQRNWEGHSGSSQNASEKSGESQDRSESTDLETLAENVFPYVKRILEIEAERSSGKLR